MPMAEIERFSKMEQLLESKLSRRFQIRKLEKDDFGYIIEHLYGQTGVPLMTTTTIYRNDTKIKSVGKEIRYSQTHSLFNRRKSTLFTD